MSFSHSLPVDLDFQRLPHHVAVIMDGNGRWATRQGLPRIAGHRQGAKALKALVRCCKDWGVPMVTAYAFSTENWNRSIEEVNFLMSLFEQLLKRELAELHQAGVRIAFIGDLSRLPEALQAEIHRSMLETRQNQTIQLNIAMNYGSRNEMTRACRQIAAQVQQGELDLESISESLIEQHLYTADIADPDLLIRTSGEMRLSNYLLWQLAYTELYFTDVLFPDFDRPCRR
jgi:undecaprenyl diphosphate synthase